MEGRKEGRQEGRKEKKEMKEQVRKPKVLRKGRKMMGGKTTLMKEGRKDRSSLDNVTFLRIYNTYDNSELMLTLLFLFCAQFALKIGQRMWKMKGGEVIYQ